MIERLLYVVVAILVIVWLLSFLGVGIAVITSNPIIVAIIVILLIILLLRGIRNGGSPF